MAINIFFCYAHEDEPLLKELQTYLEEFRRNGLIDIWYDRDINAGMEWESEIDSHLNKARIILLLVSQYFMASDYCFGKEMKRAIERHEHGEARVIPIILRPVHWEGTPIGKLQALPSDARAITSRHWHNQDEAFFDVAEGIRQVINALKIEEEQARKAEGERLRKLREKEQARKAYKEIPTLDENKYDDVWPKLPSPARRYNIPPHRAEEEQTRKAYKDILDEDEYDDVWPGRLPSPARRYNIPSHRYGIPQRRSALQSSTETTSSFSKFRLTKGANAIRLVGVFMLLPACFLTFSLGIIPGIIWSILAITIAYLADSITGRPQRLGFTGAIAAALLGIWLMIRVIRIASIWDIYLSTNPSVPLIRTLITAILLVVIWQLIVSIVIRFAEVRIVT